jgi:hypothetical protein
MNDGPELPPWAQRRHLPEARPTWVVVLALTMMMFAGLSLRRALPEASDPDHPRPFDARVSAHVSADIEALNASVARSYQQHPVAVRVNIASRLAVAALMLLAVAAVFASDPRARGAAILAACAGIVHQVGDLVFGFLVFAPGLRPVAPVLIELSARHGAIKPPDPAMMASAVDLTIALYIVGPVALNVAFSVVLLTFFGGKRGRSFFGVGAGPNMVRRQPHHGG